MFHSLRLSLSPSLLLSLLAVAATAQTVTPPPVQLGKFDVTADRSKPLTVPSLEAARAELLLVPGGVETIDSARFLRGRSSTVEDMFALSAGVIAQSRFGSDEARLSIRGSGLQRTFHGRGLRILQDGVPLNLADGSFDMQAFEPLSATYINVWRGGNALAYGASTLGGAIDFVTRTGRDATPQFARAEFGSWEYRRATLTGGGTRGDLDGWASFTHQSQSGFRDHAEQSNQRFFGNAGLRLADHAETRLYVTAVQTDSELPGNLTRAQLRANRRQANAGNLTLDQKRDFELLRLASKTTVRTGATVWDFTASWSYKDLDHPIFQVIDQVTNDLLVGAVATHTGASHRLRAGVLVQRGTINAANYANIFGRRGALVSDADQIATNYEAFAEDQIGLGRQFTLVLGASAAKNIRENRQGVGGVPSYELRYDRLMPKVGLRYDLRDAQVYANVSGSYEPPSFSETLTLNTARSAQTATTYELGTRGYRGALRWDASVYHAALRKELLTLDHDRDPATAAATINADRTTHSGIELAAELDLLGIAWGRATPTHRLVARAAWTYVRFRFDDDARYGNNVLAGFAPHIVRGELTWEHASGWYAGPTVEWAPQKTFIDFRNTFAVDPYAIYGFRFGRRIGRGLSWFVEARNVFDKLYSPTTGVIETALVTAPNGSRVVADQPQFLPGDGRSFFGGIEWRF